MSTASGARDIPALKAVPRSTRRTTAWERFRRHRLAVAGLGVLLAFGILAAAAPSVLPHGPNAIDLDHVKEPPSLSHILGTDVAGRDVFARIVIAGRVSMSVGLVAALIASVIGTIIGLVSGYAGSWVDDVLQRFTELVMTFPTFFAVIILVALLGPSVFNIMLVIGFMGWTGKARLVRGQVLSLREMDYVTAGRAVGASTGRLLLVHILPGVMPFVAVAATLTVAGAIITEASLSFLGLGVQIPTATWGNMMMGAQSLTVLRSQPWLWIPPGLAIGSTVLGVNFVGDGLRDALDPRVRIG